MTKYPYAHSSGKLSVTVKLKNAADVFLVDSTNGQKFHAGKDFKYYGGHYDRTPVHITVSGVGKWYLVVIGSDYKYVFS